MSLGTRSVDALAEPRGELRGGGREPRPAPPPFALDAEPNAHVEVAFLALGSDLVPKLFELEERAPCLGREGREDAPLQLHDAPLL